MEPAIKLTDELFDYLRKTAKQTHNRFLAEAAELVDVSVAKEIRWLRVDDEATWRGVAYEISKKYKSENGDNQIWGMALCEVAAKFFGENANKDPWN